MEVLFEFAESGEIELAEINDLEDIMKMIHNCANDLISKNIFQWNEKYPSRD